MFYPVIGLDGENYYDLENYIEGNARFLEKMGTDIKVGKNPFIGLDGLPYNSALERQRADLEFVSKINLENKRLK